MPALRIIALIVALIGAMHGGTAQAGEFWDSLWRNADQRGEHLLQQGDAAAAARTYAEPRRKAYAELQAGNNAAAASDFAAFDDSDGHYNRGNALARIGDLKQALQAYDAALAHDPQNQDAQHNRDLVAKALRDQQQQQKQPQQSQQRDGDSKPSDQQASSPNSDPADAAGKQGQPPPASSQQHAESRPPGDSHHSREKPDDSAPADEQQAGRSEQSKIAPSPGKDDAKDEAGQAQRDAQDALQRRSAGSTRADPGQQQPMTEQQLAEEQWLRQIPDDPGGLLRRKFMIEHMLRHQQQPEPFNSR
ncbi:tetratricopeptide repeat protein [Hydrocarboniphaga sp.]|uniref:tetratricopeptide repeat protein n=1 Tax=Hydrocarboniphaga sp. TaxID=2033016 RepID=UPI003D1373C3